MADRVRVTLKDATHTRLEFEAEQVFTSDRGDLLIINGPKIEPQRVPGQRVRLAVIPVCNVLYWEWPDAK